MSAYFFYLFSTILISASVMVILAHNPVHSILFLVLAFFNAAGLFVLLGAEFLAMMIAIVYVGAVAVLFLFVVMMLDIKLKDLRQPIARYMPAALAVGGLMLTEIILIVSKWHSSAFKLQPTLSPSVLNTHSLGYVLYTDYGFIFHISGVVLLLAMVGAILLTLRQRSGVKRQHIGEQVKRRPTDVIELHRVTHNKKD